MQPNQTGTATVTTTYGYDALHRQLTVDYSDTTPNPEVTCAYEQSGCMGQPSCYNVGRRTSMGDASGSSLWSYDAMGRPLRHTKQRTSKKTLTPPPPS